MFKKVFRMISDEELSELLESTGVTFAKREDYSFSRVAFLFTHVVLFIFLINLLLRIFIH